MRKNQTYVETSLRSSCLRFIYIYCRSQGSILGRSIGGDSRDRRCFLIRLVVVTLEQQKKTLNVSTRVCPSQIDQLTDGGSSMLSTTVTEPAFSFSMDSKMKLSLYRDRVNARAMVGSLTTDNSPI